MFVRWQQQTLEAEERSRLPGYRDEATVRHFEAPGSVPTRFYEVRAKSVLNRVPESSAVPFRWTINPYRGCSHACSYCIRGETPVLMADGRHRPIELLSIGDRIVGTQYSGRDRRYVETEVLDQWMTMEPAYRLTLADGTELVTSGDHRFLSNRGWKHVSAGGDGQRPHLTRNDCLIGVGCFAEQPMHDEDYRRGYLCGMIRGDGTVGHYAYESGRVSLFRLALADLEPLARTQRFLDHDTIAVRERIFSAATQHHREVRAIASGRRADVQRVGELTRWPILPRLNWCRGFLAGIFDAEGSRSGSALRISNTDPETLTWIETCARRLDFDTVLERGRGRCPTIRIRGGLREHLRFFHLTDPAMTRKRSITGEMVKTFSDLRVVSIEPLGCQLPLYDITSGTGDFIADGVISHNCFARPTHKYLEFDAGRDFEREIVVKVNAPEVLRTELARPRWQGEHVALGTNTDPYQWVEGRYRLMRGIWAALRDAANPCSILTKSPLLLRDLDLMREIDTRTDFSAALSVPTIDERAWRATEPHTPNPRARLEAIRALTQAGIRTGVLIAPLMPGINDDPAQVEEILRLATEAGASYVSGIALHLRGEVRQVFFAWLADHRPDLLPRYRELYRRGAYAPVEERRRLARLVRGPDLRPSERTRPAGADPGWRQSFPQPEGSGRGPGATPAPAAREPAHGLQRKLF